MAKKKRVRYRIIPKERRRNIKKTGSQKLILGLLVVFIVLSALYIFSRSDYFTIDEVHIEGNIKLTQADIINTSGIRQGDNIFSYNTSAAEEALSKLSFVQSVSIVRDYPSEVYIYIKERSSEIAFLNGGIYYYLDSDGIILKSEDTLTDLNVILVSFASDAELGEVNIGTSFDFSADARLGVVKSIYDFARKNDIVDYISEIYVSESGVNYLYTVKSNVVKFYTYAAFEQNKDFIKEFIIYEDRHIMAEVVEDSRPVYKVIEIK